MGTMTQPELAKPPVIEIFADLVWEGDQDYTWDYNTALAFLNSVVPSGRQEYMSRFSVKGLTKNAKELSLEQAIERVRSWTHDEDACVQIGASRIVVNRLKRPQLPTPRFSELMPVAQRYVDAYCQRFKPKRLLTASLGYVDDIIIPVKGPIDLKKYFKVGMDFPNDFGPTTGFRLKMTWEVVNIRLQLEIASRPISTFRFTWIASGRPDASEGDDARAAAWLSKLDECHSLLRSRFFASFTDDGLRLFGTEF